MKKLISYILFISFCFTSIPYTSYGATAEEVRSQIESTANQIEALNKEIAKYEKQITTTSKEKDTLATAIKKLVLTRDQLIKQKQKTESQIKATGLVITTIDTNIHNHEKSIDKSRQSLSKALNDLHRSDQVTILERILSKDNLSEASREYNNLLSLNENVRKYIFEIEGKKESLEVVKNEKEDEKENLTKLKKDLTLKETAIGTTKKEKDTLLTKTKNKESEYQKLLAETKKKRDAFEKSLAEYEDQLKFILNPKLLPKEGTAVLSWPLSYVFITQLFGVTSASKRLYRSGSHSGVDFRASVGTPVKSMGIGTVMGTGDTDIYCKGASFGKWVFIKYDNGLSSTFGHLSVISAKAGDKVNTGDIVGLSGNTGHSTGPHLHVSLYASEGAHVDTVPSLSCSGKTFIMPIASSKAYLDPMLYLPKILASQIKK